MNSTPIDPAAPVGSIVFFHHPDNAELPLFRLTVTERNESTVSGIIERVTGWDANRVPDLESLEHYLRFYMRFDGCCHFWFGEPEEGKSPVDSHEPRDSYLHLCGASGFEDHLVLLSDLWQWAAKVVIQDDEGFDPAKLFPSAAGTMAEHAAFMRGVRSAMPRVSTKEAHAQARRVVSAEKHEAAMLETIDERDGAEKAMSEAFALVTGQAPEWSSSFGYGQALDEMAAALAVQPRPGDLREQIMGIPVNPLVETLSENGQGGYRMGHEHARTRAAGLADATDARIAELEDALRAAKRLLSKWPYMEWATAGGPAPCPHGYGEGIACPKCDAATVDKAIAKLAAP